MPISGLLVDYGGVLTTNLFASFAAFCSHHGLHPGAAGAAFAGDREARRALVAFERGQMADEEFERRLAERLGLAPEGLIQGLFAEMQPERAVIDAVAAARRAGVRTGLVSNSWGRHAYDRSGWELLFDVTVISGELGVRKPDPEIYDIAVERLGVPAAATVFVDDLAQNLEPAARLGMTVVHHSDPEATVAELERLLEVKLR